MSADALAARVGAALGARVTGAEAVSGGSINRAARLTLSDGRRAFVKHHPDAPPGVFRAEADGLAWLAAAGALRTPEVLAVADDDDEEGPRFLALEWIAPGRPDPEAFGRGLAALHAAGAPAFGWDRDNFIGPLPQLNDATGGRLARVLRRAPAGPHGPARGGGGRPPVGVPRRPRAPVRAAARAGRAPEPPARLHGDLWGGNALLGAEGGPAVVDPAVHGGHREVDLAMMRLFGGFPDPAFAAYEEAFPLAEGHAERVGLWQLHPVLVHVCLFGGAYAAQARRIVARYL